MEATKRANERHGGQTGQCRADRHRGEGFGTHHEFALCAHVLLETDDMDAVTAALEPHGIRPLQAGTGIPPGARWVLLETQELVCFLLELRHRVPVAMAPQFRSRTGILACPLRV